MLEKPVTKYQDSKVNRKRGTNINRPNLAKDEDYVNESALRSKNILLGPNEKTI